MKELDRFKQMPPCPAEALISSLGEILPRIAGTQERHKVTDVPTLRTLRFYVAQGLMDKPLAYENRTALYGYRHLLQVVVIKCLQANHIPIRKIREVLQGRSNAELEQLLELPTGGVSAEESALPDSPSIPAHSPPVAPGQKYYGSDLASPLLRGILQSRSSSHLAGPQQRIAALEAKPRFAEPPPKPNSWRRLEVEPGVEIHLREDFRLQPGSQLEVLLTRIKHLLKTQMADE
jgi:DNA-binding transcriptional MerR regulator